MKKKFLLLFLSFQSLLIGYCPEQELGPLFRSVQMENIFGDSKTFVDCDPKCCPNKILTFYFSQKPTDLKEFVDRYFQIPDSYKQPDLKGLPMQEYLMKAWDVLIRSSLSACHQITTLIPLPETYVVAGERFREMYYWDTYFSMLGLSLSDKCNLVEDILQNFIYLIDLYGFIPNGNRSYYLTRSQPPFFSLMARLSSCQARFLPYLEQEYGFWMRCRSSPGEILNHYSDAAFTPRPEGYREDVLAAKNIPEERRGEFYHNIRATAESGWDFSSRWLNESGKLSTTQILPVDLNCLLYHEELLLAELYAGIGCHEISAEFQERASRRKEAIQKKFWNEEKGFYFDYNFVEEKQTGHYTLAGIFPLLFQIATPSQAEKVMFVIKDKFLKPGGVVTTLVDSGQQWDFPNGWPPLQWATVEGLRHYGYAELADEIVNRWLYVNEMLYKKTGLMFEKYNVVDIEKTAGGGEYPLQAGFGWTNGIDLYFLNCLRSRPSRNKF